MSLYKPTEGALSSRLATPPSALFADPTVFLPKAAPSRWLGVIRRRGWLVLLAALLGALGLFAYAGTLEKSYLAKGSVYLSSQAPLVLDIRAVAPEETRDLEQMRSVEQGLSATTLLMKVIQENGLDRDPTFAAPNAGEQALVDRLKSRVVIELRRGTRLIDIRVSDRDPERARRMVESFVTEYEKWTNERQTLLTQKASDGLSREEVRLRQRMEASAATLQQFRQAHPIPGMEGGETGSPVRDSLASLNAQLNEAKAARLKLEAQFEAFSMFDAANPQALSGLESSERGSEVLTQIRILQQKETEFNTIKERYLFKHPAYRQIANEIEGLKKNLAETVRTVGQSLEQRYGVAKDNEQKLAAAVALARTDAVDVEGVREQFRSMSRDAEADRTLHDAVDRRLRETSLAASVPSSVLRWEDEPLKPDKAASPRKIVFAAIGGLVGSLAGLGLMIGQELGKRQVRDAAAVEQALAAPCLVSLPTMEKSGDEAMVLVSAPASSGAEAFRQLRVVLSPAASEQTARTVLFTSALAGEGKSLCALNYAAALAMQGHRTLLLDADLREGGLSRQHLSGSDQNSGLGGYLAGKMDAAETCFTTSLANLYLLASGPVRSDAAELLAGTRFPSLLEDAFRWFDRIVIDTSTALASSDTLAIARYADRVCLVVREGSSDLRQLKRTAELLRAAGGNLTGFVWNGCAKDSSFFDRPGVPVHRAALTTSQAVGMADATAASSPEPYAIVASFCS
jgi:polysaccharide biosynthesis transport protein